jgi:hypothetical protein
MTEIIRTRKDGCFQVRSNAWGQFLAPVADPDASADLEKGALERFELHSDIHKIPAELWSRWVQLCFHFAHLKQGDLEVSCRLLRKEDDRSQWRILVPRQEVTGASVRIDSFDESIDIETGELIKTYPPEGWVPAGSSHSHNTMQLDRFSSTDDASELGCPGLHIVISHIDTTNRTYRPTASVTASHRRFYLDKAADIIDLTPVKATFHPSVLEIIQPERIWPVRHLGASHPFNRPNAMGAYGYGSWMEMQDLAEKTNKARHSDKPRLKLTEAYTDQEEFDWALRDVWESIRALFETAAVHGMDPDSALAEVLDAAKQTHSQFHDDNEPLFWLTPDHADDGTDSLDPAATEPLPVGEW